MCGHSSSEFAWPPRTCWSWSTPTRVRAGMRGPATGAVPSSRAPLSTRRAPGTRQERPSLGVVAASGRRKSPGFDRDCPHTGETLCCQRRKVAPIIAGTSRINSILFIAQLNLSVAFINMLPVYTLDGGLACPQFARMLFSR